MNRIVLVSLFCLTIASSLFAQSIASIEINQGIGIQKGGARKFVAGKDTAVRVFLSEAVTVDPARSSARIVRDGEEVAVLVPNSYEEPTKVVDFLCKSLKDCGGFSAGSYTFKAVVNGIEKSTEGEYLFVERGTMRILAVPVKANYGGKVVPVSIDRWKTFGNYLKRVYPIAADKLVWETREEIDASEAQFDLETDEGRLELWQKLAKLIPPECETSPNGKNCFQQVFGFIEARPNGYPNGTLQGYTYGKPANIGVATDEDAEATVAHEIGHTYGLGDTYNGGSFHCQVNPAPDKFEGKDFNDPSKKAQCKNGKDPLEGVGGTKIVADDVHPYEIGGRGALPDMAEYMGSDGKQAQFWSTQEAWDRLFDQLKPPVQASESGDRAVTPGIAPEPEEPEEETRRFIEIYGVIRENASRASDVTLDPWWTYEDDGKLSNTSGKYMVAAVDASGTRLATAALDVTFDPPGSKGQPWKHLTHAPFDADLEFPENTVKFQILRDGIVIREVAVSGNAPSLWNVAPEVRGAVAKGSRTVSWQAMDVDSQKLYYQLEYNADVEDDPDDWWILERDLTENSVEIDFDALPGGSHAKLRVTATDGLLGTIVEGGEFVVPVKAPEVEIFTGSQALERGQTLLLSGDAFDLQDELEEGQLEWKSSISGSLGTGSLIKVDSLPVGVHIITLTATNDFGLKGTAQVGVRVYETLKKRPTKR